MITLIHKLKVLKSNVFSSMAVTLLLVLKVNGKEFHKTGVIQTKV